MPPSRSSPSAARSFSSPSRIRPLTVPSGVSSISAISVCVKPPKYASSMTRSWSAGSVVQRLRGPARRRRGGPPRRRCARRASKRSSMPSSLARRESWTVERRSASIARLWTMPRIHVRTEPRCGVVARARAPQRQERLLDDVVGRALAPAHAVGERVRGGAVAVVDHAERLGVAAARAVHELLVGEGRSRVGRTVRRKRAMASKRHYARPARPDQRLEQALERRTSWPGAARAGGRAPVPAPAATTPAAIGRATRVQLRGSLSASSSHDSSSSHAASLSARQARLELLRQARRRLDRGERLRAAAPRSRGCARSLMRRLGLGRSRSPRAA